MHYIGITGEQRSGKSTLAEGIQEAAPGSPHIEISDIITEVANDFKSLYLPGDKSGVQEANQWLIELPDVLYNTLGLDTSYGDFAFTSEDLHKFPAKYMKLLSYTRKMKDPTFRKEVISPLNKEKHREILQALGGMVVSVAPHAWYDEAFQRIQQNQSKDSDLAIVSTVAFPSDANYISSRGGVIVRINRSHHKTNLSALLDPTDSERPAIKADIVVHNDGSLEQLHAAGKQLVALVSRDEYPSTLVCSEL